jgi:hypothetical protein
MTAVQPTNTLPGCRRTWGSSFSKEQSRWISSTLPIAANSSNPGVVVPFFVVNPSFDITEPRTILVTSTQTQYSQVVHLDFASLTWPHVSVATLVPAGDVVVPDSAFD